jgi:multidrug resistance efflux pump
MFLPIGEAGGAKHRCVIGLKSALSQRSSESVWFWFVLVLAVAGLYFFAQAMSYESTDDAFIDAHTIDVVPKIAGRIDKVFIGDNWLVRKGDPIVEIDPRDYDAQLRQKQAALDSTKAQANSALGKWQAKYPKQAFLQ